MLSIFIVILLGTNGYYVLTGGKASYADCLYMTVISLTTVGYGEIIDITNNVPARMFTIILITFGMGIILYGISTLTVIILEGELSGILRKNKMAKTISKLTDHFIVCGGGETGRPVLVELTKNKEMVVLIEQNEEDIERCRMMVDDLLFVKGDATDDENLIDAGIEAAAGIIVTLPSDKDNLYVTMTARMLNSTIRIICRMTDQKLEPKLYKAGADGVVSPNSIGALRMASEMIRPTAVDFLDSMLRSSQATLRINQIAIPESSNLVGKKIKDTGLKDKFDLLVLGSRDEDYEIEFNPSPDKVLSGGTILVVMGDVDALARVKQSI